jgi:voltage-gated potassium channel
LLRPSGLAGRIILGNAGDVRKLTFKQTIYALLEETGELRVASRSVHHFLVFLIVINIAFAVLETVDTVKGSIGGLLQLLQLISGAVFLAEYILRVYVADMHPPLRRYGPLWARLRYAVQPTAIIDLIAALPLLLVPFFDDNAVTIIILLRLLRFLKLARYSPALRSLLSAIASERQALMGSFVIICGLILLSATLLYLVEKDVQQDKFGSIPHAFWWAIATITTVGYGDVVPITSLGKTIGGVVMLMGYGMIALPVGIIASAFAHEIHSRDFVVTWSMVARVPLFEELTAAEVAEVSKLLKAQKVRAGTKIAVKGEVADKMYFIADGEVEIKLEQREIYLAEGEFFGSLALIHQQEREATVTAYKDCDLMILEAAALQQLMDRAPELATKILDEAEQWAKEGRRILGDLAEEELAMADIYWIEDQDTGSEPELFKPDNDKDQSE